ncbi:MAG: LysR family transcriptional regulator [Candidatus Hydrogenedentota bacterium]
MLNLDAIETFCVLVETGNFRRASEHLNRTQPAVTQQLKRLEAEVGHLLLDRKRRVPTPKGELLYAKGKKLLQDARDIPRLISDEANELGSSLRVGTSDTNALYFLPEYVRMFTAQWPETKLEIHSRSTDSVAAEVVDGKLDLGIITLPLSHADLETRALYHQQLQIVVPREHRLTERKTTRLGELTDEPFVLLYPSTRTGTQIEQFFTERNFDASVSMYSGSFEVVKRYVREGLGIAILPEMVMTSSDADDLVTLRMDGLPKIGIGAIWHKDRYQTKVAQAFLEILSG